MKIYHNLETLSDQAYYSEDIGISHIYYSVSPSIKLSGIGTGEQFIRNNKRLILRVINIKNIVHDDINAISEMASRKRIYNFSKLVKKN